MNGRTSDFSDILDFDRYFENNDLFSDISHIPMRVNQDHFVDSHGRKLLDLCKMRWRSGAVVRASDFGPRGPWFEPRPMHISLWP